MIPARHLSCAAILALQLACAGPGVHPAAAALHEAQPPAGAAVAPAAPASGSSAQEPPARDPLRESMENPRLPAATRVSAIRAFRDREGLAGEKALEPLLSSETSEVREAAAAALGTLGGEEARRQLQDRLDREENFTVREALQQSLAKLEP